MGDSEYYTAQQVAITEAGRVNAVATGSVDAEDLSAGALAGLGGPFAPLASPALTGNPTAPTQSPGNSTTRLATTAFSAAAVAVETARATAAELLLAPLASPTFTGVPAVPTAAPGTNTTQAASTAFVRAAVAPTTGTAVLDGTTPVVVNTAAVTASSVILMTQQVAGGTQSGIQFVVSRVPATSFTIASVAGDTSTVGWQIVEPAA